MYVSCPRHDIIIQRGFRRAGLTLVLAPRMPAMTEEVRQIDAVTATVVPKGYIKNKSRLSKEQENTGFNEPPPNLPSGK